MSQNILIIGDSLSAGYGLENPQTQGWVGLLQARLKNLNKNIQVINASISGDTTSNGLARLPAALGKYHPIITIIELGGNDGLRGIALSTIEHNLSEMILLAKHAHSQVILVGVRLPPNYGPAYTTGFQNIYKDLAQKYNINLVPLFLKHIDENPELIQSDGIHPTDKAQEIMLNNLWPVLKSALN